MFISCSSWFTRERLHKADAARILILLPLFERSLLVLKLERFGGNFIALQVLDLPLFGVLQGKFRKSVAIGEVLGQFGVAFLFCELLERLGVDLARLHLPVALREILDLAALARQFSLILDVYGPLRYNHANFAFFAQNAAHCGRPWLESFGVSRWLVVHFHGFICRALLHQLGLRDELRGRGR